ncbi:CAP domain-containing protein [Streptomyces sp. SHP 1-2]|nr:CAP domain-containing protein [Streptomyces sp. SHP 1-2]
MGSRRAVRPSRSHARPRRRPGRRGTALALGAAVVATGAALTLTVTRDGGGGPAEWVTADAVAGAPGTVGGRDAAAAQVPPSPRPGASASGAEGSASGGKDKGDGGAGSPGGAPSPGVRPSPTGTPGGAPAAGPSGTGGAAPPGAYAPPSRRPSAPPASGGGNGGPVDGGGSEGGPGMGSGTGSEARDGADRAGERVLVLVNEERARAGCAPVTANGRLARAADAHSGVMAASGVMSHTGPDGSTMADRVGAAGYEWAALGENIARGQADAASVMAAWMDSPGHRANILNCSFEELGVGVRMGDGGPWWTQDFGTGR